MALFYLLLGVTIPILHFAQQPVAAWSFSLAFGFAMGGDYMLIPLVTAECFGATSLGKLLMTYESLGNKRYETRIPINNLVLTGFSFRRL
jgi:hypothetical protein